MMIVMRSSCRIKSVAFKFFLIQHTIAMGNIIGQFTRAQANCNIDFLITGNWLNEHEFEERSYCGRACDCNANIVLLLMCGLRPYIRSIDVIPEGILVFVALTAYVWTNGIDSSSEDYSYLRFAYASLHIYSRILILFIALLCRH